MSSFHGDISNIGYHSFQFDKIFQSRYKMDLSLSQGDDGVGFGRFVLIKYEFS